METGNQWQNTSSCQIKDLIEMCVKTQNPMFVSQCEKYIFESWWYLAVLSPDSPSTNHCELSDSVSTDGIIEGCYISKLSKKAA